MVRHKKRYIVVEIQDMCKRNAYVRLKGHEPHVAVMKAVKEMHGVFGAAVVQPLHISYLSPKLGLLLLKVHHESYRLLLSALPTVDRVGDSVARPRVLKVAATPRSAYKFLRSYNEDVLEAYIKNQKDYKKRKEENIQDSSDEDIFE